jgi:hypothetical protein
MGGSLLEDVVSGQPHIVALAAPVTAPSICVGQDAAQELAVSGMTKSLSALTVRNGRAAS